MAKLDFYGKAQVYSWHLQIPISQLLLNDQKSFNSKEQVLTKSENVIIKGDNLHALKALLPHYQREIDLIYIDPPYNTGLTTASGGLRYNDNCDSSTFRDWLKEAYVKKEDMSKHDKWLCFMWARLQIAKELLSPNGIIFMSIDDREIGHAKLLFDEIFGEDNLAGIIHRKKNRKPHNASNTMSISHEFILAYYKQNHFKLVQKYSDGKIDENGEYSEYPIVKGDKKIREYTFKAGIRCDGSLQIGKTTSAQNEELNIEILDNPIVVNGILQNDIRVRGRFCLTDERKEKRLTNAMNEQRIFFNSNGVPKEKRYIKDGEGKVANHYWDIEGGKGEDGDEELIKIFNISGKNNLFPYPKPSALIKHMIRSMPRKNLKILDFFAGSGTTGQAVLDINKEEKESESDIKHNFILIEQEDYIDSITTERIKRTHPNSSFQYFDLKKAINKEQLLLAKNDSDLYDFTEIANQVCLNSINKASIVELSKIHKYYVGKDDNTHIFLIYEKSCEWLSSDKSSLTEELLNEILAVIPKNSERVLIFGTSRFMSHEELVSKGVYFLKIPFDL